MSCPAFLSELTVAKTLWIFMVWVLVLNSCADDNISRIQAAQVGGDCENVFKGHAEEGEASFYYYRGLCERRLENHELAIADLCKAEHHNFRPIIPVYLNLASSYAYIGHREKAYEYLDKLVGTGYKNDQVLLRSDFDAYRSESHFISIDDRLKPSFDIWMSLFLFVALQAIFLAFLLFLQPAKNQNKLLGTLILCFAIVIFSFTLYWSGYNSKFPYLNNLYHLLPFITGPLFYVYIRSVTLKRVLQRTDVVHFVPFIMAFVIISPWLLGNFNSSYSNYIPSSIIRIGTHAIVKIGLLMCYLLASIHLIRSSHNLPSHLKSWLKYLLWGFTGYVVTMLSYYILVRCSFFNPAWDYAISFALSFFIFLVSFMGYLQPRVMAGETVKEIIQPTRKYQKTSLSTSLEQKLAHSLRYAMEVDHLFKNGDLRLDDIAKELQSNRHDISMVINKHFGVNFFDFLNQYRIEYVIGQMSELNRQDDPLIQLAHEAGFNNKVTFRKAFKKFKGVTPSHYRQQLVLAKAQP